MFTFMFCLLKRQPRPLQVLRIIMSTRALRRSWQYPCGALLEASIASLPLLPTPDVPPTFRWFIVGLCIDRIRELCSKLAFASILTATAWTDTKQRARRAGQILAVNAAMFPVVVGVLAASSLLSTPVLPLLGVPIFVIGFPRPK